jgi:hypothetical protein
MATLHHLESNILEVVSADAAGEDIVADPIHGQWLYHAAFGWGRLWKWFYQMAAFFGHGDMQQRRLQNAIDVTHDLFRRQQSKICADAELYGEYLQGTGFTSDDKTIAKARRRLVLWHQATCSIIKLLRKSPRGVLRDFIAPDIASLLLRDRARLKHLVHIVGLEGLLQGPAPFDVLRQEACGITSEAIFDKQRLDLLVKKLNKYDSHYGIRRLERVLHAFIEISKGQFPHLPLDLTTLFIGLIGNGYKGAVQPDCKHLRKRGHLAHGSEIFCNGRRLLVGNSIISSEDIKIYGILNAKQWLAIAPNKSFHHVKRNISHSFGWGVPLANYLDIDVRGKCACIEPLVVSLDEFAWKSSQQTLHAEDRNMLIPIVNLLQWCVAQDRFPMNLSARFLGYARDGHLKTLKTCVKGPLLFNTAIDFICDIAHGNSAVFRFILHNSGLLQHRCVRFYRTLIEERLLNATLLTSAEIAAAARISDGSIVNRGEEYLQELLHIKRRCCETFAASLHRCGHVYTPEQGALVARTIVNTLIEMGTIGVIPPHFEQTIKTQFLVTMPLT